jgi:lipoprotein-anchoring transpeptidase ErfK/SrfK
LRRQLLERRPIVGEESLLDGDRPKMKWFMRLTGEGVGMHVGILPGYPASHGCIRMPEPAAAQFYSHVKVGTPVRVDP